jgi:hypothetical protein
MNIQNYLLGETPINDEIKEIIEKEYATFTLSQICNRYNVANNLRNRGRVKEALEKSKTEKKEKGNLHNFHVRCACNKKAQEYELIDGKRVCKDCPNSL